MRYALRLSIELFVALLLVAVHGGARAEYVAPLGYTYGVTLAGTTTETKFSTPQEAAAAFIAAGNAYYSQTPGVRYTLLRVTSCADASPPARNNCSGIDWFMDWHFSSRSTEADYPGSRIWVRLVCPSGYSSGQAYNLCWRASPPPPPPLVIGVTANASTIPQSSVVAAGKVLTRSELTVTVLQNGSPALGKQVTLTSSRTSSIDRFDPGSSSSTDKDGKVAATVSTRSQPAASIINASVAGVGTPASATIPWLPAEYEGQFLVTCYTIADEALAPEQPISKETCGLPKEKTYRTGFLRDVQMQGSGRSVDGTVVHYAGHGCYNLDTCARTATGTCAAVGSTIAVDPKIIPLRSSVDVQLIGSRKAQDTGGLIQGYHVDEYLGPQPKLCHQLGRRTSATILNSY